MPKDLINALELIKPLKIIVVGDMILDRFVWGNVDRISPEAPIPVLKISSEENRLGGAANVAANFARLGGNVTTIGFVGNDDKGDELLRLIKKFKIKTGGLVKTSNKSTIVKTRMIAHNQQVLRIDREDDLTLQPNIVNKIKQKILTLLERADIIVISDYNKKTLSPELIKFIIKKANLFKVPVLVDPKGKDYNKYIGATAITPNEHEAEIATGIEITNKSSLIKAAKKLVNKLKLKYILITRGEKGMALFFKNGKYKFISSTPRTVFDVTGAGDTAIATFGIAIGSGIHPEFSAELANVSAGIVVGKLGTGTVSKQEIFRAIFENYYGIKEKIKEIDELANIIKEKKERGLKISFTNGCFDLLHPGHIQSIKFAKNQGDILVLAINSDTSVKKIKGEARPIISERDRAQILAAMEDVDFVTIFNETTPLNTIKKIKPDILIKGNDWKNKKVVGEDFIRKYGGKVVFNPTLNGFSTTKIVDVISRIAENGNKK